MTKKKNDEQRSAMGERLNVLRAGVLGSNDGILTVVGVLFSVAVATPNRFTIFIAGLSDLLACAFSMASGEYASVSTQRDMEKVTVKEERSLLQKDREGELTAVRKFYMDKGVSEETAEDIAIDLLNKKPLETVVDVKHGLILNQYMNPWNAAFSSLFSAALGGVFPLVAMTMSPEKLMWPITILAVCLSVALTGYLSAKLGNGMVKVAIRRNLVVGIITMIIHYTLGLMI